MKNRRTLSPLIGFGAVLAVSASLRAGAQEPQLAPGEWDASHRTFASYKDVGYDQPYRAQFHFSSLKNWLNDPNGMVYSDGEYHLYFQHNAVGIGPGKKSWGHAVSKDMVHWEQLPHAILPYGESAIWSGTAVVDRNNVLGKQKGDIKTIVAYFTRTGKLFSQAAAYSTDRGRTFTLIKNGEPVVLNQGVMRGERDPKVFWDEARRRYVMVLILGGEERTIRFWTSENLVDWKNSGDIQRTWAAECIDLFQLPVDGDKGRMKWVLADASFDYEVGDFDGNVFSSDGKAYWGDHGFRCFYAAQVFNDAPNGRVVQIGWMKDKGDKERKNLFLANNMPFNQQMGFPTELTLRSTPEGIRLYRWPIKEIEGLYTKTHSFKDLTPEAANKALADIKPELIDLSIELELGDQDMVELNVRGLKIVYGGMKEYRRRDRQKAQVKCFAFGEHKVPAPIVDGKVKLRALVDRTALEMFANGGAAVSTSYAVPDSDNRSISISAKPNVKVNSLVVTELKSAWISTTK